MRHHRALQAVLSALVFAATSGCATQETGLLRAQTEVTGEAQDVHFTTRDGWLIFGDMYKPVRKPLGAAILLHQRMGSSGDYENLSLALREAGITALAFDARGFGRSTEGPGRTGDDAPWDSSEDIDGAVNAMAKYGSIVLIGASYGANNALIYAADHPDVIRGVVLISPGIDYHGINAIPAARRWKGPLLVISGVGDRVAGAGPQAIVDSCPSQDKFLRLEDGIILHGQHGTMLLVSDVIKEIVRFSTRVM